MKFLSSFALLASASLAASAVIPFTDARLTPVRASAAAIVEREPARATAAILAHATAAVEKRGHVYPPEDYIAKLKAAAKAEAAAKAKAKVYARGYVPYVPKVDDIKIIGAAKAIADVVARDVLHDDVAKVEAPVHGDAALTAREPGKEPHKEFVPPIIAAKFDAHVKADGVVVARDVLDIFNEVPEAGFVENVEKTVTGMVA